MNKKQLKTRTIGPDGDNPTYTICEGHVTATEFNKAFVAEGWNADWVKKSELSHEYWVHDIKGKKYIKSSISDKKAKPVTVMSW